jgi:hypothetical protein
MPSESISTYANEGEMGDVDLGLAVLDSGRDGHSEVLIGRSARFVVYGLEVAMVKDGSHCVLGAQARRRSTR